MALIKKLIQAISRPEPETLSRRNSYRLDRNERTIDFEDDELNKILDQIDSYDLIAYPELESFYNSICSKLNIQRENLLLTAGSDIGIKSVFETYIEPGDEILNFHPNYAMFSVYSKMFGANEIVLDFNEDLSINSNLIINSITNSTKVIVISNPGHNSKVIKIEEILKILEVTKSKEIICLIDEAYVDFSNQSIISFINKYSNLLVVRTMSKAYGVASIRVGFLISNSRIISDLYKVKAVHEIDGISAKIGKFLIDNDQIKNSYVETVKKTKQFLYDKFNSLNIKFHVSDTNFVYFKVPGIDSIIVYEGLKNQNIIIKNPFKGYPLDGFLRITLGNIEQAEIFINALKGIITNYEKN